MALFRSFFLGGFPSAIPARRGHRLVDITSATGHDRFALADYRRLRDEGMLGAREGMHWPLIERTPGHFDWTSIAPLMRAAEAEGVQIVWSLFNHSWPNDLDIFHPQFVYRFARFAARFARWMREATDAPMYVAPIPSIAALSWLGGELGRIAPFAEERGYELKCQLVRASVCAIEAIRAIEPAARFFQPEPIYHVQAHPLHPEDADASEAAAAQQFEVWDLLCGRKWPLLGGAKHHLDVLGISYQRASQWYFNGPKLPGIPMASDDPNRQRVDGMLRTIYRRYGRPLFVAGGDQEECGPWIRELGSAVAAAIHQGLPIEGICVQPVLQLPGTAGTAGLWGAPSMRGERSARVAAILELRLQRQRFAELHAYVAKTRVAPAGGVT